MSNNDFSFRCPVCRARQALQEDCRRCGADLRLVVRAHRRLAYLLSLRHSVRDSGNRLRERQITEELQRLAPGRG